MRFKVADAQAMPIDTASFDGVVSGLVLNFVPDPGKAAAEMWRAARAGGVDAAVELNPEAADLDEGRRFPICKPERLAALFSAAGLKQVETTAVDAPTVFRDFDDYWSPFLGGQGPAPGYTMSLNEARRAALRELLRRRLPIRADGSIPLVARAWAVKGGA